MNDSLNNLLELKLNLEVVIKIEINILQSSITLIFTMRKLIFLLQAAKS